MKKCLCCEINDAVKYSKYTNGNFCSSKCARSYSTKEKRKEINEKVSRALTGRVFDKKSICETTWKIINKKRSDTQKKRHLKLDFSELGIDGRRKRVLLEQNDKCNRCKLNNWLGEPLTLELEHIDGDHNNNQRDNLEALCPNCHSLTLTWRGRNKSNKRKKIDDKILLEALLNFNFNMRQALLSVGLAAKGGNYNRCHRLKREYEEITN